MMAFRLLSVFIVTLSMLFYSLAGANETKVQSCLKQVKKLNQKKSILLENGGLWAHFSKSSKLRASTANGLQLDSKINRIMSVLQYLCETIDGVPLNDLASYLVENLQHKSKPAFRAELIILGKNHGVIDVWMKFHEASLQNQHRSLELDAIEKALQKALVLLDKYGALHKISDQDTKGPVIALTQSLLEEIDSFLIDDPMMSLAIKEDSQVPYWDINESSGGS